MVIVTLLTHTKFVSDKGCIELQYLELPHGKLIVKTNSPTTDPLEH